MEKEYFTTKELAKRWNLSPSTIEQWRWLGIGPFFNKFGRKVSYSREEVEKFENQTLRQSTTQKQGEMDE